MSKKKDGNQSSPIKKPKKPKEPKAVPGACKHVFHGKCQITKTVVHNPTLCKCSQRED